MLTESREAMNLIWSPQNLAIASLSSPQFDANPFLPASDRSTPPHPEERPLGRVSKDGRRRLWPSFETPRKMRGSSSDNGGAVTQG
jgi:hypothetical protein